MDPASEMVVSRRRHNVCESRFCFASAFTSTPGLQAETVTPSVTTSVWRTPGGCRPQPDFGTAGQKSSMNAVSRRQQMTLSTTVQSELRHELRPYVTG